MEYPPNSHRIRLTTRVFYRSGSALALIRAGARSGQARQNSVQYGLGEFIRVATTSRVVNRR